MFGTTPGLYSLDVIATPTPGMTTKNISGVAKCSLGVVLTPECLGAQSRLILCDPMDCSPPDSSVHGILQARTLEWVAISFPLIRTIDLMSQGVTACHFIMFWNFKTAEHLLLETMDTESNGFAFFQKKTFLPFFFTISILLIISFSKTSVIDFANFSFSLGKEDSYT